MGWEFGVPWVMAADPEDLVTTPHLAQQAVVVMVVVVVVVVGHNEQPQQRLWQYARAP